ncbi:unnamed protein product [Cladocopium goreaui]|uniref:DNA recombinase (Stage IV sporulation protein CA) n=1 Tax=Cladocopium goreaui TaxID=2562237 RepID=A0A9P1FF79_9DINO|nr:unnamed protein product [Cladocopium goreaui]
MKRRKIVWNKRAELLKQESSHHGKAMKTLVRVICDDGLGSRRAVAQKVLSRSLAAPKPRISSLPLSESTKSGFVVYEFTSQVARSMICVPDQKRIPVRYLDDPAELSSDERLSEISHLLATGFLRLVNTSSLPPEQRQSSHPDFPGNDLRTFVALNITKEVNAMKRMTVRELRDRYVEVFGEATNCRNKDWFVKRIAWRLQANEEGDLSERARLRAAELANDADLRVTAPRESTRASQERVPLGPRPCSDDRLPLPGTLLTRDYKGRLIEVKVLQSGFEFEGELYKSLSGVAKAEKGQMTRNKKRESRPSVRCAIYTRKSTEEGLEQEFNTLDAQREAGEAYIRSQQHEGWDCIPDHYDDGGFTGGNMDRPALRRLMADIEAGRVDCVVVYKVDRLSRSLLDFARMMEVFDQRKVSFVSVTQQFNTASSMGRLILNVLLSFAQFEREMISERTRDKIAATRRKGKWSGGMPVLGYDVVESKLVVNQEEADRVQQIFEIYLESRSLLATVKELNQRGWLTKSWTTRKETRRGGKPFNKTLLHKLLTNVTYIGKVRYKAEVHDGEHQPIVDSEVFEQTQRVLNRNGRDGGQAARNKHGALLRGLLHCASCGCAMTHSFTTKGKRRYRYYLCTNAQKRGWHVCETPSIPAGEIERFIVDQIKCIGRDPALVAATLKETARQTKEAVQRLKHERTVLGRQRRADEEDLHRLAGSPVANGELHRLVELQERIGKADQRLSEIEVELARLISAEIDEADLATALADFDTVWEALKAREQARIFDLLIERIDHDGKAGNISIQFQVTGIKALAEELAMEHAA